MNRTIGLPRYITAPPFDCLTPLQASRPEHPQQEQDASLSHLSEQQRSPIVRTRVPQPEYCSHSDRQLVYQKQFNHDGALGNETRHKARAAYKGSE